MKAFPQRSAIADRIEVRHWEVRSDTGEILRVVSSDGPGLHGVSQSMMIGDEPWCWSERAELLEAMESSLNQEGGRPVVADQHRRGKVGRPARQAEDEGDVAAQRSPEGCGVGGVRA